jgi:hypothetical protein
MPNHRHRRSDCFGWIWGAAMLTAMTIMLGCLGIFLELADRAPILDWHD